MKLNNFLFLLFFFFCSTSFAQNLKYAKWVVDTLSSPFFQGRGYVLEGDKKAAIFLENEFKKIGLVPIPSPHNTSSYLQNFNLSVNTFPYNIELFIGKKKLNPGNDYLAGSSSGSCSGKFKIKWFNQSIVADNKRFKKFQKSTFKNRAIFIDRSGVENEMESAVFKMVEVNLPGAELICSITNDKLTWAQSNKVLHYPFMTIYKKAIPYHAKKIKLHIKNEFLEKYQSQNIIGFIKGTLSPDSFIVLSAHYDHLGRMGQVYFPGANDNASGIAIMLDLANYFFEHPLKYSVAFMAFGGEENGLIGSKYYTENPLFPLEKIKYLINLDLMGNGEKGVTVVNGSYFETFFNKLIDINFEKNYLENIYSRGKAQNSDHYYFTEKGVKSFFIYTHGGSGNYHDIFDKPETLTFAEYEDIFRLLVDFINLL